MPTISMGRGLGRGAKSCSEFVATPHVVSKTRLRHAPLPVRTGRGEARLFGGVAFAGGTEGRAALVPFGRAETGEDLGRARITGGGRMLAGLLHLGQKLIADTDDSGNKQARHDGKRIA